MPCYCDTCRAWTNSDKTLHCSYVAESRSLVLCTQSFVSWVSNRGLVGLKSSFYIARLLHGLYPLATEIVPEKWHREMFTHTLEGPDDMTGHVKVSSDEVNILGDARHLSSLIELMPRLHSNDLTAARAS